MINKISYTKEYSLKCMLIVTDTNYSRTLSMSTWTLRDKGVLKSLTNFATSIIYNNNEINWNSFQNTFKKLTN